MSVTPRSCQSEEGPLQRARLEILRFLFLWRQERSALVKGMAGVVPIQSGNVTYERQQQFLSTQYGVQIFKVYATGTRRSWNKGYSEDQH